MINLREGAIIIIVGGTGSGKSVITKCVFLDWRKKKLVYDLNNDYSGQKARSGEKAKYDPLRYPYPTKGPKIKWHTFTPLLPYDAKTKTGLFRPNQTISLPLLNNPQKVHIYLGAEAFLKIAPTVRDTVVVFEDAGTFCEGNMKKGFKDCLANRRHTNNIYILQFHYFREIPPRLRAMAQMLVQLRTGDDVDFMQKNYPKYYPTYRAYRDSGGDGVGKFWPL